MAGSLNTQRKVRPTCLWKQAQTFKKKKGGALLLGEDELPRADGPRAVLRPGLRGRRRARPHCRDSDPPRGSGRTSGLGKDVPAPAGGSVRRVPGAARRPPGCGPRAFRRLVPVSVPSAGSGLDRPPDPELPGFPRAGGHSLRGASLVEAPRRCALRCVRWLRGDGRRRRRRRLLTPQDTLPVARASGRGRAGGGRSHRAPHAQRRKRPAARSPRGASARRKVPRGGAESGTRPGGWGRAPAEPSAGAAGDLVALCAISRSPVLRLTCFKTGEMSWSGRPAR